MSTNDANQAAPPESDRSYAGLIIVAAIIGLGIVWTYIFFGGNALGIWAKAGATAAFLAFVVWSWRWRRAREQQQLQVLQRWAEADESAAKRPKRGVGR